MKNTYESLLVQADTLLLRKDYDAAEQLYKTVLQEDPANSHACYKLGSICIDKKCIHESGEILEAKKYLEKYLQLKPDDKNAWMTLGQVSQSINDSTTAINAYRNALMLDMKFSSAAISLSDVLFNLKKYNEAGSVLQQALSVNEQDVALNHHMAGLLNHLGLYGSALSYSEKAVNGSPDNISYILRKADILEHQGEAEQVFYTLKPLLEDRAVQLDAVRIFAKISPVLGMKDAVVELLDYISKRPDSDEANAITNIRKWLKNS